MSQMLKPSDCPICGNADQTRNVAAIVRDGSWSATTTGFHTAQGYAPNGQYTGASHGTSVHVSGGSTQLAQLLAAPAPPRDRLSGFITGGCLLLLVPMFGLIANSTQLAVMGLIPAIGLILVGVTYDQPRLKNLHAEELTRHDRQMAIYNRLTYCGRCDTVTDPLSSKSERIDNWKAFLWTRQ